MSFFLSVEFGRKLRGNLFFLCPASQLFRARHLSGIRRAIRPIEMLKILLVLAFGGQLVAARDLQAKTEHVVHLSNAKHHRRARLRRPVRRLRQGPRVRRELRGRRQEGLQRPGRDVARGTARRRHARSVSSRRRPRRRPTIARLGAFRPRTSPRRRALRGAGHFTNGRSARPDGHLASSAGGPSFTNERRLAAFVRRSAAYDERPARRATNKQSYTIGTKPAPEHARRADAAPRRRAPTPRNEARRRPVYSGRVSLTV